MLEVGIGVFELPAIFAGQFTFGQHGSHSLN